VAFGSQPKLWFVDAPAPVYLPEKYQCPFTFIGSYGEYVVAHRRGDRHVGLITSSGDLAVQVRCPRSITDVQVAEEALVSLQAA